MSDRTGWDDHWGSLPDRRRVFGALSSGVRRLVISRAVRSYVDRYFAPAGTFLEAGVGTGQTASRIELGGRRLVALDFSVPALLMARQEGVHRHYVCADARALPFRDEVFDGVWNLGVVEHFEPPDVQRMLVEARRSLRPGRPAMIFWPPAFGSSRLVLGPIEWIRSVGRDRPYRFFPDEVNRLRSRRQARHALRAAGLAPVASDFTPRDGFIHVVVVGRKPPR